MAITTDLAVNLAASAIWAVAGIAVGYASRAYDLDTRLTGQWEGDLTCENRQNLEFQSHVIHCVLVLARPSASRTSGLLYYNRECFATRTTITRGVDALADLKRAEGSFRTPEFNMKVVRRFHINDGNLDESPKPYDFKIRFPRFERVPALQVQTEIACKNGMRRDTWTGVFQKK